MFTGLVEKVINIENFTLTSSGAKLTFCVDFDDIKLGSSIAVNGVCLSVSTIEGEKLTLDIMLQTLNTTNLKYLKKNDKVNLERALLATSRLDGHIVTGHVDDVIEVQNITQEGFSKIVHFQCNTDYIVEKGSITLNGVSLTARNVQNNGFDVALIPETLENTNLKHLKIGSKINVEYDILAKYIQKYTSPKKVITEQFLIENGF
ncbi:riboflavin synthase [bacterium]|nr:riboflavin synthase [bacterium]